ncbi:amidohydrolase family protein [Clostridia bacterium]|nr:amidohydrolase family protein [Clostridia bacterium]
MSRKCFRANRALIESVYVENAYVLVQDGLIMEAGSLADWDGEADEILDCPGVLLPGLIDAHCHIGLLEEMDSSGDDVNELGNPVQPALRVIDGIYPTDALFTDALASGITTVGIMPGSSNLIGGQGASLYTAGSTLDEMLIQEPNSIKGALGENPKRDYGSKNMQPYTRMGEMALLRKALYAAKRYWEEQQKNPDLYELDLEPLKWLLERKIPFRVHAHRYDDIQSAMRLAKEFHLELILEHATGAAHILDELKESDALIALGPFFMTRCKREMKEISDELPALLEKAGIPFCIISDAPELPAESLRIMAMQARKKGLSEMGAIASLTSSAARVLGLDERIGTLAAGYEANMVSFDKDPLDFYAKVRTVWIKGEEVYHEKANAME